MKYTIALGEIAHLALRRFRKKAADFIMSPEIRALPGKPNRYNGSKLTKPLMPAQAELHPE
jgi:hypothetical protein